MAYLLETVEEVDQLNDSNLAPRFHVVLLNDDFHTYDYIVDMLGKLFFLSPVQAFRHAVEIDTTGRSIVLTCELDQAEFARQQIHSFGADPRVQACRGSMSAIVEPAE